MVPTGTRLVPKPTTLTWESSSVRLTLSRRYKSSEWKARWKWRILWGSMGSFRARRHAGVWLLDENYYWLKVITNLVSFSQITIVWNKPRQISQNTGEYTEQSGPQPASSSVQNQIHSDEKSEYFTKSCWSKCRFKGLFNVKMLCNTPIMIVFMWMYSGPYALIFSTMELNRRMYIAHAK